MVGFPITQSDASKSIYHLGKALGATVETKYTIRMRFVDSSCKSHITNISRQKSKAYHRAPIVVLEFECLRLSCSGWVLVYAPTITK